MISKNIDEGGHPTTESGLEQVSGDYNDAMWQNALKKSASFPGGHIMMA